VLSVRKGRRVRLVLRVRKDLRVFRVRLDRRGRLVPKA